jgi:hypothetical protein
MKELEPRFEDGLSGPVTEGEMEGELPEPLPCPPPVGVVGLPLRRPGVSARG